MPSCERHEIEAYGKTRQSGKADYGCLNQGWADLNQQLSRLAFTGDWQGNRTGNQQILDLILAVAAVATKGSNCGEFSSICPSGHRLWINPKKGCNFGGSHKDLGIRHRGKPTLQGENNSLIKSPNSDISEPKSPIQGNLDLILTVTGWYGSGRPLGR
jgi:hypothetical protein